MYIETFREFTSSEFSKLEFVRLPSSLTRKVSSCTGQVECGNLMNNILDFPTM